MSVGVRALVAVVLVGVAMAIGALLRRRRPVDAPTQSRRAIPTQIDRKDFDGAAMGWLVVVFSSATCSTCALVIEKAMVLASDDVAVQNVEYPAAKTLHDRYGIDAVPTVLVADQAGVVRTSFQGPVTATDLWAAVAKARQA